MTAPKRPLHRQHWLRPTYGRNDRQTQRHNSTRPSSPAPHPGSTPPRSPRVFTACMDLSSTKRPGRARPRRGVQRPEGGTADGPSNPPTYRTPIKAVKRPTSDQGQPDLVWTIRSRVQPLLTLESVWTCGGRRSDPDLAEGKRRSTGSDDPNRAVECCVHATEKYAVVIAGDAYICLEVLLFFCLYPLE